MIFVYSKRILVYNIQLSTPLLSKQLPYLLEYKSHFFVPENQSKNGGATYTRG